MSATKPAAAGVRLGQRATARTIRCTGGLDAAPQKRYQRIEAAGYAHQQDAP